MLLLLEACRCHWRACQGGGGHRSCSACKAVRAEQGRVCEQAVVVPQAKVSGLQQAHTQCCVLTLWPRWESDPHTPGCRSIASGTADTAAASTFAHTHTAQHFVPHCRQHPSCVQEGALGGLFVFVLSPWHRLLSVPGSPPCCVSQSCAALHPTCLVGCDPTRYSHGPPQCLLGRTQRKPMDFYPPAHPQDPSRCVEQRRPCGSSAWSN
jgi:hypothetical protein